MTATHGGARGGVGPKPLDAWLAGLEWRPLVPCAPSADDTPYATHEAVLSIEGMPPLRVYQLSDGRRVINLEDAAAFFSVENGGIL